MPKKSDTRLGKKIIDKCSSWFEKAWSYTYELPWLTDDANLWLNLILQPIDLMQYCKNKFGEWKKEKNNKKIAPYENLLGLISSNESKGLIEHFIAHCDNLSYKNKLGKSFLIQAAQCSRIDLMEVFLENKTIKSTINFQDNEGNTALFYAIQNQIPTTTAIDFIKNGARLDIRNNLGDTLLIQAVKNNDLEAAKALIVATKAQSNSYIGKFYGWVKSKIFGIEINPIIDTPNKLGLTPLHVALQNQNLGIVQLLLENNIATDLKCSNGKQSALIMFIEEAIKKNHKEETQKYHKNNSDYLEVFKVIDKLLLKEPAINNKIPDYLRSAICSFMCYPSELGIHIIKKLFNNIDKNVTDDAGKNALHIAVGYAYPVLSLSKREKELQKTIIKKLIELGVNKNLEDKSGYTPLDLAYINENHEINDFLTDNFFKRSKFPLKEYTKYKCDLFTNETFQKDQPSLPAVMFRNSNSNGTNPPPPSPVSRCPRRELRFDLPRTPRTPPSKQDTSRSQQATSPPSQQGI